MKFNVIHVGAATPSVALKRMKSLLAPEGIVIAPMESGDGQMMTVYRLNAKGELEKIQEDTPIAVRYVPLKPE